MSGSSQGMCGAPERDWYTRSHATFGATASMMALALARCCAAYAEPSANSRGSSSDLPAASASRVGMEWVANSTRIFESGSASPAAASFPRISSRPAAVPSRNGCTTPGVVEVLTDLVHFKLAVQTGFGQRNTNVFAVLAAAGVTGVDAGGEHQDPAVSGVVSVLQDRGAMYGSQFRLPQRTGNSIARCASSASIAAFSSRFCWLMGLIPPKAR